MSAGLLTEPVVAKEKRRKPGRIGRPPSDQVLNRVEILAPPEWIDRLDDIARRMGLSRAAYIRLACNAKMQADEKSLESE